MPPRKAKDPFSEGVRVRAKEGTTAPEFPTVSIAGWTGAILEVSGQKATRKLIVQWDEATVARIPADYAQACESSGCLAEMACLSPDDVDVIE